MRALAAGLMGRRSYQNRGYNQHDQSQSQLSGRGPLQLPGSGILAEARAHGAPVEGARKDYENNRNQLDDEELAIG